MYAGGGWHGTFVEKKLNINVHYTGERLQGCQMVE